MARHARYQRRRGRSPPGKPHSGAAEEAPRAAGGSGDATAEDGALEAGYVVVSAAEADEALAEEWAILTGVEIAQARADEAQEALAAWRAPTCGICLDPAGSTGLLPDGCSDSELAASPGAGLWWRMRLRLNARTLPCRHVHCAPCWSSWEKSQREGARRRGRTLGSVRCPLCNAHVPMSAADGLLARLPRLSWPRGRAARESARPERPSEAPLFDSAYQVTCDSRPRRASCTCTTFACMGTRVAADMSMTGILDSKSVLAGLCVGGCGRGCLGPTRCPA
jgi:hypothetical protein